MQSLQVLNAPPAIDLASVRSHYRRLLDAYSREQDERLLLSFNELGCAMEKAALPPEIAVETHALAIQSLRGAEAANRLDENELLLPLLEVVMAYGVTFRRQLAGQEEKASAQFYQVLKQTRDMVFITDTRRVISYANPAYQQVLKEQGGTFTQGSECPQFIAAPDCENPQQLWRSLEQGESFKGNLASTDRANHLCIWSVSAFPLFDKHDHIVNYVFLAEDIGKKLKQEKRNRQSQRLATLGELASGVSHEFNNILLIISGFSELLLDEVSTPEAKGFAQEILQAVEKGRELNKQILSFSRDEECGKPVKLATLVTNCRTLLEATIGSGVRLTFSYPDDLIVTLSETHLCQLLTNLVINASHAISDQGPRHKGEIHCRFYTDREGLVIGVEDNGTGMSEALTKEIFEPFFTTKKVGEGSGLGLSIVQKIVHQYQGLVEVNSRLGIGTEFKLRLPVLIGKQKIFGVSNG